MELRKNEVVVDLLGPDVIGAQQVFSVPRIGSILSGPQYKFYATGYLTDNEDGRLKQFVGQLKPVIDDGLKLGFPFQYSLLGQNGRVRVVKKDKRGKPFGFFRWVEDLVYQRGGIDKTLISWLSRLSDHARDAEGVYQGDRMIAPSTYTASPLSRSGEMVEGAEDAFIAEGSYFSPLTPQELKAGKDVFIRPDWGYGSIQVLSSARGLLADPSLGAYRLSFK